MFRSDKTQVIANQRGTVVRQAKARVRHDLANGTLDWQEVIRNPPACVSEMWLTELLLWVPGMGRWRVQQLARVAYSHGVNLVVPAGRSAPQTREWIVEHGVPQTDHRARTHRLSLQGSRRILGD